MWILEPSGAASGTRGRACVEARCAGRTALGSKERDFLFHVGAVAFGAGYIVGGKSEHQGFKLFSTFRAVEFIDGHVVFSGYKLRCDALSIAPKSKCVAPDF